MKLQMTLGLAAIALVASTVAGAAYPTNTTGATYLHTGPGAKYSLVTPVPPGAKVNVQSCNGSWCRVVWTQYAGYMPAALLATVAETAPGAYAPPPPVDGYAAYPLTCDPNYDATCDGYDYGGYGYSYGVYRGHGWGHGHNHVHLYNGPYHHGFGGLGTGGVHTNPNFGSSASPNFGASPRPSFGGSASPSFGGMHASPSFGGSGGPHSFGGFGGGNVSGGGIWRR